MEVSLNINILANGQKPKLLEVYLYTWCSTDFQQVEGINVLEMFSKWFWSSLGSYVDEYSASILYLESQWIINLDVKAKAVRLQKEIEKVLWELH